MAAALPAAKSCAAAAATAASSPNKSKLVAAILTAGSSSVVAILASSKAEEALYAAGVDVVLSGHVHAYERTHPTFNGCRDECGPVYLNWTCKVDFSHLGSAVNE